MRIWIRRVLALLVALLSVAATEAPTKKPEAAAHLRDPNLFHRLAAAPYTAINRVEGDWAPRCDSLLQGSGSPLECFTVTAEVPLRSPDGITRLFDLLDNNVWVRSKGWISPAAPTLAFTLRGDSLDATVLISLQALKAMLAIPGEGTMGATLAESLYTRLAWCLWRIDPDNPELRKPIQAQLRAHGFSPETQPPKDELWGEDVVPDPPGGPEFVAYDEGPEPVQQIQPVYPEMAKEANVQGRVILHALVGIDGRVKRAKVIRSVSLLDQAAMAAVRQWVFKPALRDGEPVAAWVEIPIDFNR